MNWKILPCSRKELNLDITLTCGQSFRWRKTKNGEWISVFANLVWLLKQDKSGNIHYKSYNSKGISESSRNAKNSRKHKQGNSMIKDAKSNKDISSSDMSVILKDYFQLEVNLSDLYRKWSQVDKKFSRISESFSGVRILRQDPVENLISFICSSNNNIPRITNMVEKLCSRYGDEILETEEGVFYSFPPLETLAEDGVEEELRKMGFGYRAKYIHQTALHIVNSYSSDWLLSLRDLPYEEARACLVKLPGVGGKVADCVCLMSLDKKEAVPVDTHVWQIAVRDYLPHLKCRKSMTDKIYWEIGNFFREHFGEYAGWAHSVLFSADLAQFKHLRD